MSLVTFIVWEHEEYSVDDFSLFRQACVNHGTEFSYEKYFQESIFQSKRVKSYGCVYDTPSDITYSLLLGDLEQYILDALMFDLLNANISVWRFSTWIYGGERFDDIKVKYEKKEPVIKTCETCKNNLGHAFIEDHLYRIVP